MTISDEKIEQLQQLYQEHFGKKISKEEAYQKGMKLLRLVRALTQPKVNYDDTATK